MIKPSELKSPIPVTDEMMRQGDIYLRPGAVTLVEDIKGWLRSDGKIYRQPFLTMPGGAEIVGDWPQE